MNLAERSERDLRNALYLAAILKIQIILLLYILLMLDALQCISNSDVIHHRDSAVVILH